MLKEEKKIIFKFDYLLLIIGYLYLLLSKYSKNHNYQKSKRQNLIANKSIDKVPENHKVIRMDQRKELGVVRELSFRDSNGQASLHKSQRNQIETRYSHPIFITFVAFNR